MISFLQKLTSALRKIGVLVFAFSLGGNFTAFSENDSVVRAAQSQAPVLRVQVDLQSLAVRVTDKQGRDVRGLSAEDFTVLEDSRPQKIAFFGAENVPTSLSILVDSSSSMDTNRRLGSAEAVAAKFMGGGRPGDEISAMDFTDQFGPFQQLTQAQLLNPSSVPLVSGPGQGSALYDAIAMGVCHLRDSKNLRKAIVVITDGDDQQSRITLDQLIAFLQSSRVQLFTVGWHTRPEYHLSGHVEKKLTLVTGHDIDNPSFVFDRLAKEAGAETVFPTSADGMDVALKKVSDLLEAQYTIAYYPEDGSKQFRRIDVKPKRRDLVVTVQQGVASNGAPSQAVHFVEGTCDISPRFHPYPYESRVSQGDKGIVYHETFSDPRTGWPIHEGSRYTAGGYELSGIEGTKLHLNPSLPNRQPGGYSEIVTEERDVLAAYGPWWDDFRVSAVVDPVMGSSENVDSANSQSFEKGRPAAGLVFRLGASGYYAALLSGNRDHGDLWLKLVTRRHEKFSEKVIVPWMKIDDPQRSRNGINLAVEAAGSQITIFVDGKEAMRVQDSTFAQGYVGFVLSGAERAIFRDLSVEGTQ
jgi:Ca-activated chloride channel family protein